MNVDMTSDMLSAYASELQEYLQDLDDDIYRDIMCSAINTVDLIQSLRESPYGLDGALAYPGGLLIHVVHSIRLSNVAIKQAQELETQRFNPSLVIAGCTLRNIGWHTTTKIYNDDVRTRNAYYMTGIYRASMRYIDHLILSTKSCLEITIPESHQQVLENMCNKRDDINTLEGKIVACADNMADTLDFGAHLLKKQKVGSWCESLFIGHFLDE